ncbi:hypothetical protein JW721_02290 [Candidatus Micrarchaeota archaeon]|nr:hypothetical protein [Candidatus Micrarchaeota archaeon]
MVLGIGEGKIELELNTREVSAGGKISGKLKLDLPKPRKAKGLRVEIIGERKERDHEGHQRTVRVYQFKKELGGEQEYASGEYEFELPAPKQHVLPKEGALGAVAGIASAIGMLPRVRWYVVGVLDLPMSFDINKKVQIEVG